ncbi:hypothetical protein, partial [Limnofasciculus baicalensis]
TRQWFKPLSNSLSQLKLTGMIISVHFNGLQLLDREFILWRVWQLPDKGASYELKPTDNYNFSPF